MSNPIRLQSKAVEPIEDRIDSLFRELELAVKWQRPSILFAVYTSEYIHTATEADLENRMVALDQKVVRISMDDEKGADITGRLSEYVSIQNAVFFVTGLRRGCSDGTNLFLDLNNQREFFVEKQLRLVFWLTEKEVIDLANQAPDFWAFRHRVIEFNDSPEPEQILQKTAEVAWQGTGEYTDPLEDIDAKISFRESLLTNLPNGNEAAAVNGNLLLTLGILHWRKGDYEKASEFLKSALDVAIAMKDKLFAAECFNAIALVKTGLGRTDEAIEAYQRAIQLAPTQIFPWNNLGILFSKLDRNEDALVAFKKAIQNKPGDSVSWNGLGEVYMKLDRHQDAVHAYLKAIELTPKFASAWTGLGNAFALTQKTDQAFRAYQEAIRLNNRSIPTILGLAKILASQGHDDNAIQAYESALSIDPKNVAAWNELGNLFMKIGSHELAIMAYGKVIELCPANGNYYSNKAQAYLEMGVYLEAIPLFEKSLTLFDSEEDKAETWDRLGNAYRLIGDYTRAVAAYQTADALRKTPGVELPETMTENFAPEEADTPSAGSIDPVVDETPSEPIALTSSLDSKESRVEPGGETNPANGLISESVEAHQAEESSPIVDGDHLQMLDKTLSEIEEMIARQSSLLAADSASGSEDALNLSEEVDIDNNGVDDKKDALEWNELGNTHLIACEYDEAIFAYTRAIEMAPDFNWPYIKNLAMAYYQKGKHNPEETGEEEINPAETLDEGGEAHVDLDGMHELDELSNDLFSTTPPEAAADSTLTVTSSAPEEHYSLDGSSLVEPFIFDANVITKELLHEAEQEGLKFRAGRNREKAPANREIIEDTAKVKTQAPQMTAAETSEVEINPGNEKFQVLPKSAYEWNELGNIYLKIGANDKAIDAFNKAIEMDPYFGWAYSNLALAYNHSKKFQESIPLYKKSIELIDTDKGKAISYNRLGDVYRHLNDQDNAMKAYKMASDLDGDTKPILSRARMVLLNNM